MVGVNGKTHAVVSQGAAVHPIGGTQQRFRRSERDARATIRNYLRSPHCRRRLGKIMPTVARNTPASLVRALAIARRRSSESMRA
jgi:hypothetical protein